MAVLYMIMLRIILENYLFKAKRLGDYLYLMLVNLLQMKTFILIGQDKRIQLNFGTRELDMSTTRNSKTCNNIRLSKDYHDFVILILIMFARLVNLVNR